ncbi:hypothetical protein SEA_SYRA333_37 [Mycobacterium phage Syra333]|uniref:Uncharacterized protein n=2 Tax=Unicornvirus TaxID=2948939 RepID=A0A222ZM34_9CAUD|nr:hypothetical protein I5G80_gp037 [Mycobacterium phage Krueger]YP_009951605.1 hypothetical protein I5G82_gp069 [Mycobacterium phage Ximenita]UTN93228.1 hypothetical protein SEA_SUNFLOWER1121_36 [Mycobacterium Phage Sunflower1121]WNM69549.1 hypothetical protein SEA_SYRA333_37 [Mycobacterium phage Syra333]ASR85538.1 hypothetical protein SEA_KRUEGER_37 [Mycobacterium phage Krueger]QIG61612.1 hypothetical protein SEA_XIMENITA_38 [Mycobacterium phage Ximenita]
MGTIVKALIGKLFGLIVDKLLAKLKGR